MAGIRFWYPTTPGWMIAQANLAASRDTKLKRLAQIERQRKIENQNKEEASKSEAELEKERIAAKNSGNENVTTAQAKVKTVKLGDESTKKMFQQETEKKKENIEKLDAKLEEKGKEIEGKVNKNASKAQTNAPVIDKAQKRNSRKRAGRMSRRAEKMRMKIESRVNEQVVGVKANMQELIDAEKEKSGRYLSLARKYYCMWKTLNEQQKRAYNSQRSLGNEYSSNVRFRLLVIQAWFDSNLHAKLFIFCIILF